MLSPRNPFSLAESMASLHALGGQRIFSAQVDIALPRAGNETANCHALENGEGIAFHEDAVFEGARLGFVGIADDVVAASGSVSQQLTLQEECLPFLGGGKCCAATTQQLGSRELTQRAFRAKLQSFAQTFIAAETLDRPRGLKPRLGQCDEEVATAGFTAFCRCPAGDAGLTSESGSAGRRPRSASLTKDCTASADAGANTRSCHCPLPS